MKPCTFWLRLEKIKKSTPKNISYISGMELLRSNINKKITFRKWNFLALILKKKITGNRNPEKNLLYFRKRKS